MRSKGQQPSLQRKLTALVAGLCLTIILTVCFMVAVVQVQSAITAYTWGESVWVATSLVSFEATRDII
jgi:hypothetical protein